VLLDLDGTVWDANPWYADISGEPDTKLFMERLADGRPVAILLKAAGLTPTTFARRAGETIGDLELVEGVDETLERLRAEGAALGGATTPPGWIVTPMLEAPGLGRFFGAVIDWNSCPRRKPRPDPLLLALEHLGVRACPEVWYVGDSGGDCEAAHSAGLS